MDTRGIIAALKARKRSVTRVGIALAAVSVIAGVLGWYTLVRSTGVIPRAYQRGWQFTLYTPTKLPAGYTVDQGSFERKDGVLIFSLKAPDGKNIAVSEQAAPSGGVPRQITSAPVQPGDEKLFSVSAGNAHLGLWGDKYVCDIPTADGTWIILNVTGFTADQAASVAQAFTKL